MHPVLSRAKTERKAQTSSSESNHNQSPSSSRNAIHKRNSRMIFRIENLVTPDATTVPRQFSDKAKALSGLPSRDEHNIRSIPPTTTPATTTVTTTLSSSPESGNELPKEVKEHARAGVFVAQFTPKDTLSETFSTLSVMSIATGTTASSQNDAFYCNLSNSTLCMTPTMLRRIKLSEDIHSHNALFELYNGNIRVRIIRDIESNAELIAWFGEEATLLMSIPFLTPLNIQGNKRYTCHLCRLTFETPNPLKIHLALGCGRHSLDILWIRLHYALKAITFGHPLLSSSAASTASLSSLPTVPTNKTSTIAYPSQSPAYSTITPTASILLSTQPTSHLSAFTRISAAAAPSMSAYERAYQSLRNITTAANTISAASIPSTSALSNDEVIYSPSSAFMHIIPSPAVLPSRLTGVLPTIGASATTHPLHAAAQIEAIVSNMGTSKQGHLCIYCGKIYSRKYGLKIHIRTHTGFKPLKCKFCLRPFGDPSNLNKHVRLHLQTAGAGAASSSDLSLNTGATPSSVAPASECYRCQLCHKILARRRDLQRHMESRHSLDRTQTQTQTLHVQALKRKQL